jgi:hypothetical protein
MSTAPFNQAIAQRPCHVASKSGHDPPTAQHLDHLVDAGHFTWEDGAHQHPEIVTGW